MCARSRLDPEDDHARFENAASGPDSVGEHSIGERLWSALVIGRSHGQVLDLDRLTDEQLGDLERLLTIIELPGPSERQELENRA
jgi:hypothetical protein